MSARSLYSHLDACDHTDNAALTAAFFDWLDERIAQGDVLAEVERALPWSSTEAIRRHIVDAVARQVRRP